MDVIQARENLTQVENGLKLALLIVGGIGGALGLAFLIAGAVAKQQMKALPVEEPCTNC